MTSAGPVREWVGGRLTLPARVESMGDRRPEMSLWVELPDLHVVGQILEDPQEPEATFGQSLMRSMASPLIGEPRRPQRVRVADAALAEQLKSFSFLTVEVAPTPELDQVARALGAFFGDGSYFSDPSLGPQDLERFFLAARALWMAHPWTIADDDALLHVEIPALGVHDGCISVVGSLEEVRGFVLFPSYDDYELMMDTGAGPKTGVPLAHSALYFSFDPSESVPEGMRKEVAEHGWPLADGNAYPMLLRMVDGQRAPVLAHEVQLASAIMRAVSAFVPRHPLAFEAYGEEQIRESLRDDDALEVVLTVPHPLAVMDAEAPPRAQTLTVPNSYGLPLETPKRKELERTLGSYTLHRMIGWFCGVASLPQLPAADGWLGDIMRQVKFASERHAVGTIEQLTIIYNHVVTTLEHQDIDGLIPEADDDAACREWARGYTAALGLLEPSEVQGDAIYAAFAIEALAEHPDTLELLDETRGDVNREIMLAGYREALADNADFLLTTWKEARAKAAEKGPATTFRRDAPRVGRNDPCPCGSGKKYKKCCADSAV